MSEGPAISVVEIAHNKTKEQPTKIFKDFNNSIQFIPPSDDGPVEKKGLQVQCPQDEDVIEDINKVHLKSFNYKFSPSDLYMQSTIPSIKIGKKVKKSYKI